ncbi:glyoxalase [Halalkalibacillus sediminis]|uniref:Glyoxalase n=1 Tax=Halalkalibacillus sediminis TaxID=2018042 RepID=A0A2I0QRW6_9BACI|nr:VOC family protein [Halalkalibacillus sediminis]PKR77095.1 glyoxalase [Halalkalibacillus sediminis]
MNFHQLPTKHIEKISLNVTDLEKSIEFYKHILGFDILTKHENHVELTLDGERALVELVQPANAEPLDPNKTGLFHVAYLVPKRADLANALYYFLSEEFPIQGASDHGVSEAIYLADPDGNGIEIYADRDEKDWKWSAGQVKMMTEPIQSEELIARRTPGGWNGLPQETTIGHIHLQVHNLALAEPFYRKIGFEKVANYGSQAFFIADQKYHHHIGLNIWRSANSQPKESTEAGLNWFRVKMTESERKNTLRGLLELDYDVNQSLDYYEVRDPSGIIVHF